MINTQRAGRLAQDISSLCGELDAFRVKLGGVMDRYVSNGGEAFIHSYYLDADGQPRTDIAVPESAIITAVSNLLTINTYLDNKKDVIIQAAP